MKYYMHDEKSEISSNEHAMIFQGKMIVCYWSWVDQLVTLPVKTGRSQLRRGVVGEFRYQRR